jgi:hypothetical protein
MDKRFLKNAWQDKFGDTPPIVFLPKAHHCLPVALV